MKNIALPDIRQMNMRTFFANQRNEIILTACVALVFSFFYRKMISPESALAIVGAAVLCPLFFKPPEYAVFLLVLFLPFRDIHLISVIQLKRLLIWGMLSRICIRQMTMTFPVFSSRNLRRFNIAALLFGIAIVISVSQTVNQLFLQPDSLKRIVFSHALPLIEQFLLIHIIYYSITTRKQIRTLLNIIIAVSGVVAVLGIIQYYHGGRPGLLAFLYRPNYRFYGRATSVFSNPNGFGIFLAPLIAITAVSFASHTNSRRKRLGFFLPILIVDCWAVFLTFSRTAMVQILFSILIVGYLYYIKINQKRLTRKVILILLLGVGLMMGALHYYEQFAYLRKGAKNVQYPIEALEQIKNVSDAGRKPCGTSRL